MTGSAENLFVFHALIKDLEAGTGIEPVFTDLQEKHREIYLTISMLSKIIQLLCTIKYTTLR